MAVIGIVGGPVASRDESGLWDVILHGGRPVPPVAAPAPRRPARPVSIRRSPALESASAAVGLQRTYCVRTCDGYYFAIGFVRNKAQLASHESMCASACGDAPMKLFSAPMESGPDVNKVSGATPAIERATDGDGGLYTAMPTAYAFRHAGDAACACKSTANGLPQIPISVDPTLRNGDIVVTQDGLKVFRGSADGPHADRDFVSVAGAKALPSEVRRQMLVLEGRIAQ
ncbi:DUF2865 domain-containing protein [Labrys wisconsinensis]|nr:DUF2865 domain-containing protein [Labrys wisconsinensis]